MTTINEQTGLAMLLSLSPILTEMYMNDFENHIINNSKHRNNSGPDTLLIYYGKEQIDK